MEDLKQLINIKDGLECNIAALCSELDNMGVGVKGSLVDSEGFPRADVDVHQVRTLRNKLAMLQTDHLETMKKIEAGLVKALPAKSDKQSSSTLTSSSSAAAATDVTTSGTKVPVASSSSILVPFATVDEVSEASPSHVAGLKVGDRIVKFGDVSVKTGGMQQIANVVSKNVGKCVTVEVLREGQQVQLQLTPQTWQGRGVLGCHIVPV